MICWLLPLVNLSPADSASRKFGVVIGGMVSFFVIRLVFSSVRSSSAVIAQPDRQIKSASPIGAMPHPPASPPSPRG
jgi:hypothetical protein